MLNVQNLIAEEHGDARPGVLRAGDSIDTEGTVRTLREKRLLLIEDSALLRERLTSMLTVPGTMRVAASAETESEAIEKLSSGEYDVLIVDVELRQGSGINVIRQARRAYEGKRQPLVIVLTNYSLPTVRERCMAAGADYFLDKMQQFAEVRALIETAVRPRQH
ncbi:MAG: response regulator transcription factor [Steroidobacteraceae bacterium]